jgi:hypothetical protein
MPGISRRRFLRNASLGAAAIGTAAAIGPSALAAATAPAASASPVDSPASSDGPGRAMEVGPGTEVMAHVVDQSSGTISLYAGTRKVTFQDRAVTDALLKALQ